MACLLTIGRKEPCKDSIGGLYRLWFVNYGTITGVTVDTNDIVTSIGGSAATLYEYDLKGPNTLSQNIMSSRDNGTTFVEQLLNITLKKMDATTNKEIKLLSYGRPHIIVQGNNGDAWLCGKDQGMDVVGGTAVSGGVKGDLVGYTLNFKGEEMILANSISGSTIANAFAAMAVQPVITKGTNS